MRTAQKVIALTISIVAIMLTTGCEEQDISNVKKHKLIAAENARLKKDLESHAKEIEKQKKLLEKCEQEKKDLESRPPKDFTGQLDGLLIDLSKENERLQNENKELKSQIEQLETKVQQLEKELQQIKGLQPLQPLPSNP